MTPYRTDPRVHEILLMPVARIAETPGLAKLVAVASGALAWVSTSAFLVLMLILIGVSCLDWLVDRGRVRRQRVAAEDPTDPHVALTVHMVAITQVALFGAAEWWVADHTPVETRGWLAMALGVAYLTALLRRIEDHRIQMGGPPIFGWSSAMQWLDELANRISPPPDEGEPEQ